MLPDDLQHERVDRSDSRVRNKHLFLKQLEGFLLFPVLQRLFRLFAKRLRNLFAKLARGRLRISHNQERIDMPVFRQLLGSRNDPVNKSPGLPGTRRRRKKKVLLQIIKPVNRELSRRLVLFRYASVIAKLNRGVVHTPSAATHKSLDYPKLRQNLAS